MNRDPYFFPFEIITKDNLVPGENYYMKLNDNTIKRFIDQRRNVPLSDVKGTFVRLHKEDIGSIKREYAVFKNVSIMNKSYKPGLCTTILVRYPEGFLAADGCDSYSDEFKNRSVNTDREVFLDVGQWRFGIPSERKLVSNKALQKGTPLDENSINVISQFQGIQKSSGGRKKSRKSRKNRKNSKSRKDRNSKKRYTRRRL